MNREKKYLLRKKASLDLDGALPTTGRHLVLTHRRKEGRKRRNIRKRREKTALAIELFLVFPALPAFLRKKGSWRDSERWERVAFKVSCTVHGKLFHRFGEAPPHGQLSLFSCQFCFQPAFVCRLGNCSCGVALCKQFLIQGTSRVLKNSLHPARAERARPGWADGGKPSEERGAKRANEE